MGEKKRRKREGKRQQKKKKKKKARAVRRNTLSSLTRFALPWTPSLSAFVLLKHVIDGVHHGVARGQFNHAMRLLLQRNIAMDRPVSARSIFRVASVPYFPRTTLRQLLPPGCPCLKVARRRRAEVLKRWKLVWGGSGWNVCVSSSIL